MRTKNKYSFIPTKVVSMKIKDEDKVFFLFFSLKNDILFAFIVHKLFLLIFNKNYFYYHHRLHLNYCDHN
jgi:hypothetical protein